MHTFLSWSFHLTLTTLLKLSVIFILLTCLKCNVFRVSVVDSFLLSTNLLFMKCRKTVSILMNFTALVKDLTQISNFKLQVTKSTFSTRETTNTDSSSFRHNPFDLSRLISNLIPANHKRFNGDILMTACCFPEFIR